MLREAIVVRRSRERTSVHLETQNIELEPNWTPVKVCYASVNYKDRLVCGGAPGVARRKVIVPGADFFGLDPEGNEVIVAGFGHGVEYDGGWASIVSVPSSMLMSKPHEFSLEECALIGTAGLTAAYVCNFLISIYPPTPESSILVLGANTRVGQYCSRLLNANGYCVEGVMLSERSLGSTVCHRELTSSEFVESLVRSVPKERWSAVIDLHGGSATSLAIKNLSSGGSCFLVGNVVSSTLKELPSLPLILGERAIRGLSLETATLDQKTRAWRLLGENRASLVPMFVAEHMLPSQLIDEKTQTIRIPNIAGRSPLICFGK